ncbi:MAG: LytTR family DNA-binding domain-containing protein [Rhodanobacteraceae bacterium]
MNIRVLVVDDEPLARRGIARRLAAHKDMQVIGQAGDGETALAAMVAQSPDLVFMDVQMPGMSGMDAMRALPARKRPLTVFLTAYEHFALDAFAVHAVDYLLKPIDDDRFIEALDRVRETFDLQCGRDRKPRKDPAFASRFIVRTGHRKSIVPANDIDWIEAMGDYAGLHVGDKVHLLRETLRSLSRRLDPAHFVRIHRSTIVHVNRIAEMRALTNRDSLLRLKNGTPLRVSRTYTDSLHSVLRAKQTG